MSDKPESERLAVVIPALNEESALPQVLAEIPVALSPRVIVVDNGSTDGTAAAAAAAGAEVVTESIRGYGSACLAGLGHLRETGAPEVVVFLDADHSDHPAEMPRVVDPVLQNQADLVIGSRILGNAERGALLPQARWGNTLATTLMRLRWGSRFTDLGPFRAIRYLSLKEIGMRDKNFGWTVEMQIKAVQRGLRIQEVPVQYRERVGVSKITGTVTGTIKAGVKIIYTIFKYLIKSQSPVKQK